MLRVLKYALYLLSWQCRMIQPICGKEKVQKYFECGRKTNFTERLNSAVQIRNGMVSLSVCFARVLFLEFLLCF